jgi:hypothetical protein
VTGAAGLVEVVDDKLGVIGQVVVPGTLSRTTTLTATTTNTATMSALNCYCAFGDPVDSVTVTVATPPPDSCMADAEFGTVITIAKGQSPSVNPDIRHEITGWIVPEVEDYSETAHRIKVCAGTSVSAVVIDSSGGTTTSIGTTGLFCNLGGCSGVINVKEQYKSTSTVSRDKDSITFLPQ